MGGSTPVNNCVLALGIVIVRTVRTEGCSYCEDTGEGGGDKGLFVVLLSIN